MALVIAHRGASAYAPENTLAAFALAFDQGADMIELDLQRSADGVLVVFHDDTTERWDGQRRPVGGCTLDELQALDIGGESVATFAETCAFARSVGIALNVELKQPDIVAPALAMLREYALAERAVISSFYPEALTVLHASAPDVSGAYLMERDDLGLTDVIGEQWPLPILAGLGARAWHPGRHMQALDRLLPLVRQAGYNVNVWTVNDLALAQQLVALGATGIITDMPDIIGAAIRETSALRHGITPA